MMSIIVQLWGKGKERKGEIFPLIQGDMRFVCLSVSLSDVTTYDDDDDDDDILIRV